jgi:hypothetical protein
MHLHLTLFRTVEEPVGCATALVAATAEELAVRLHAFLQTTNRDYQLWQGARFRNDHRSSNDFLEAGVITVDADYGLDRAHDHVLVPPEVETRIAQAMRQGQLRATLGHSTPRGLRAIHLLRNSIAGVDDRRRAGLGAMQLIEDDLRKLGLLADLDQGQAGYSLDACTQKAAQAMWLPNFNARGGRRQSEVLLIPGTGGMPQTFGWRELIDLVPAQPVSPQVSPLRTAAGHHTTSSSLATALQRAVLRFNERYTIDFVSLGRTCPACGHSRCFNEVPDSGGQKWFCHSSNHGRDSSRGSGGACGLRTPGGFIGDALDLAAHARGLTRIQLLLDAGLLARRRGRRSTLTFRLGE